jgi:hypothetical protein
MIIETTIRMDNGRGNPSPCPPSYRPHPGNFAHTAAECTGNYEYAYAH